MYSGLSILKPLSLNQQEQLDVRLPAGFFVVDQEKVAQSSALGNVNQASFFQLNSYLEKNKLR